MIVGTCFFQPGIEGVLRIEILKNESRAHSELAAQRLDIFFPVEPRDHGHPELVLHPTPFQEFDGSPEKMERDGTPCQSPVAYGIEGGLHVHRNEIDRPRIHQLIKHLWVRSIRVELHQEPLFFDLANQRGKISVKGRFSTRNTHPVDPTAKREKATQNLVERNGGILFRMDYETMIVAIGATEVTVGKEKDSAEFPRPIYERGFQKSFDVDHDGLA